MACRIPSCTVPTGIVPSSSSTVCYPVGGLGSLSSCGIGSGRSIVLGGPGGSGGAVSASSLGIAPGATVGCINQTPPSVITVQPPSVNITVPGPILSASCDPVRVGGYTACGGGGGGGSSSGGSATIKCSPCRI